MVVVTFYRSKIMLNLILALSLGVIIGWSFHAFYNELSTPNIIRNDINISIDKNPSSHNRDV